MNKDPVSSRIMSQTGQFSQIIGEKKNFFQHSVTSPKQNTHTYTQQIKQKSANLSKLLQVDFFYKKKYKLMTTSN